MGMLIWMSRWGTQTEMSRKLAKSEAVAQREVSGSVTDGNQKCHASRWAGVGTATPVPWCGLANPGAGCLPLSLCSWDCGQYIGSVLMVLDQKFSQGDVLLLLVSLFQSLAPLSKLVFIASPFSCLCVDHSHGSSVLSVCLLTSSEEEWNEKTFIVSGSSAFYLHLTGKWQRNCYSQFVGVKTWSSSKLQNLPQATLLGSPLCLIPKSWFHSSCIISTSLVSCIDTSYYYFILIPSNYH